MDGHVRFDPSSISLFSSTSAAPVDDQTRSSVPDEERPVSSTSQAAIIQKPVDIDGGGEQGGDDKREVKFSTYHRKKNMEVVYRRNLIDRLDKLKASQEAFFTVPQLKLVSNNQLSLFLRRLLKSPDIKQHISTEMLERIFMAEELEEKSTDLAKLRRNDDELCQFADRTSANGKPELQRILDEQIHLDEEENELTDQEVTDFEDDEIFGPSDEFTVELHDLLEQDLQILAADRRAVNMQAELRRLIAFANKELEKIDKEEGPCIYEQPIQSDDLEEDSNSSARCRAFLNRPRRSLVRHDFCSSRKGKCKNRPIISKKRCGTEEYAFSDSSTHPKLSLPSSIPLDAQIMKYLHVVDFIPAEIEMRRFKTAQTMTKGQERSLTHAFYNLEEEFREDDDKFGTSESKGIKISLPFRKALKKRQHSGATAPKPEQTDTESDPDDFDYDADPSTSREQMIKFKRRRMTYSSGTSKPSKLENRRTSHVEFGSSMFDYDAQVMDIGLPLPSIQKVENVEIVIPSFRKKSGLLPGFCSPSTDCDRCRLSGEWDEIRRLHADLEQQEKNLRFRPPLGLSVSRKPTPPSATRGYVRYLVPANSPFSAHFSLCDS
uniref:Uncharacterized protein n=1 Tax=Globodera rostochiensis TaxID=31243 RepID=A0A914I6L2_GLORO